VNNVGQQSRGFSSGNRLKKVGWCECCGWGDRWTAWRDLNRSGIAERASVSIRQTRHHRKRVSAGRRSAAESLAASAVYRRRRPSSDSPQHVGHSYSRQMSARGAGGSPVLACSEKNGAAAQSWVLNFAHGRKDGQSPESARSGREALSNRGAETNAEGPVDRSCRLMRPCEAAEEVHFRSRNNLRRVGRWLGMDAVRS